MGEFVPIDDPADPRVDDYRKLNNQIARIEMEGDEFFLTEGFVPIDRVIDSGHQIRSMLMAPVRVKRCATYLDNPALDGVEVYTASDDVIHEIVGFPLGRCVLVSANRKPLLSVQELGVLANRIVVLEGLNDNENVGTIARAARAFGFDGILLSPNCTDPYYRRSVRVSMGEILHLNIARAAADDWPDALDMLHQCGFTTWAMTPSVDAVNLWEAPVSPALAVILGAEGPGLRQATLAAADHRVRIPITDQVDSLNVGHAAAIAFAAASR